MSKLVWNVPENMPWKLLSGERIPAVGFGTFSAVLPKEETARAVRIALEEGYRFLDCAAAYGNEREIGEVLCEAFKDGLKRSELFVLSKLWNDRHFDVEAACAETLAKLQLEYLDAYLVHWPVPNVLSPRAGEGIYNEDSQPYLHSEYMQTWRAMEELVDAGKVRYIGVSNVSIAKLKLILRDARIAPAICEMELHPCFQQGELYQFCLDHGILPVGYSPVGAPARPERNRRPADADPMEDAAVAAAAQAHGVHPAEICIKWACQRGQIPIPFSSRRSNIRANLLAACRDPLTDAEMNAIRGSDRNCRLSRGEAYLWNGAQSWLDMWDIDEENAIRKIDI